MSAQMQAIPLDAIFLEFTEPLDAYDSVHLETCNIKSNGLDMTGFDLMSLV